MNTYFIPVIAFEFVDKLTIYAEYSSKSISNNFLSLPTSNYCSNNQKIVNRKSQIDVEAINLELLLKLPNKTLKISLVRTPYMILQRPIKFLYFNCATFVIYELCNRKIGGLSSSILILFLRTIWWVHRKNIPLSHLHHDLIKLDSTHQVEKQRFYFSSICLLSI